MLHGHTNVAFRCLKATPSHRAHLLGGRAVLPARPSSCRPPHRLARSHQADQGGAPSVPPRRDTLLNELEGAEALNRMPGDAAEAQGASSSADEAGGGKGRRKQRGGGDEARKSKTGPHPSEGGGEAEAAGDSQPKVSDGTMEQLRATLRERYEAVRQYEGEAAKAVLAAQTRQLVALSSPLLEQLVRLRRDLDNARKRAQAEREDAYDKAVAAVVQKLLPILDNFERAAQAIKPHTPGEAVVVQQYSGLQAELEAVLRQYGVEEMCCEGLPFDPMVHEAVMQEFSDEVPDGTVISCFQKGYRMAARKPGGAMSLSGEGDEAEGAAAMEVDSGTDSGADEGAAPPGMLVRPALVKVSMQ